MTDNNQASIMALLMDELEDVGALCWDCSGTIRALSKGFLRLTGIPDANAFTQADQLWRKLRLGFETDPGDLADIPQQGESFEIRYTDQLTLDSRALRFTRRKIDQLEVLYVRELGEPLGVKANQLTTQESLKENLEVLEGIFRQLPVALAVVDKQRRVIKVSDAALEMIGMESSQLIGESTRILYPDETTFQQAYQELYPPRVAPVYTRAQRKNGELFDVEITMAPLLDEHGDTRAYIAAIKDVTLQLIQQKELERYERIVNSSSDALAFIDTDFRYRSVNDSYLKMWLKDRQQVVGYTVSEIVGTEAFERVIRPKLLLGMQGETTSFVDNIDFLPGGKRIIEATYNPYRDHQGAVIGVVVNIRDVTERMRSESRLIESELRFRQLTENIHQVFWLTDWPLNRVAYVSPAFERIWQRDASEIYNDPMVWSHSIHPEDRARVEQAFQRIEECGVFDTEFRIQRPDGSERVIHDRGFPIYDDNGKLFRIAGIAEDITELKQQQRSLEESEQRARALLQAMPDLMFRLSRTGVYLDYKAEREDLIEQNKPTLIGLNLRGNAPAIFVDKVMEKIEQTLESDEMQQFEYDLDIPGKGQRSWEARMVPSGQDEVIATVRDITSLKADQQRLHTLSQVVEQSPEAVLLTDENFRITYLNPAFEKLFGWTLTELQGQLPDILNAQQNSHQHQQELYGKLISGEAVTDTVVNRRKDGSLFHCEYRVSAQRDSQGKIVGYMGSQRDITQRLESEQARMKLLEEQDILLDNSPALIIYKDTNNNIIRVTESVALITGLPRDQIEGRHSSEIYPEMAEKYYQDDLEVINSGVPRRGIVEPMPLNDGTYRWLSTDKIPHRNEQGVIDGIVVFAVDITSTKNAELALLESERKYRTLFERIAQGVVIHATNGQIVDCNPAAERILGYTREQLMQMSSTNAEWRCIHEDGSDFPGDTHPVMEALRISAPVEKTVMGVFNPLIDDFAWLNVDAVPLFDGDDKHLSGAFASFTDITEEHQLQQALIQSQKLEAVGRLTGGIAHDFNNILGGVLGFTDLAKRRNRGEDEKMQKYLEQIETSGLRARDLVRQLLIYSRGERTGEINPVPINPMIREIAKLLKPVLPATISIKLNIPQQSSLVRIDPVHLHQIVMNLCLNAKDAMPDGGRLVIAMRLAEITTEICSISQQPINGHWLEMSVTDSGIGIQQQQRELLFQPFYTTKQVGEGSGMGLAVIAGLLRGYKGHVIVNSEPGKGSKFRVLLPIAQAPESTEQAKTQNDQLDIERLTGVKVLVVEDEAPLRQYYRELLTEAGAETTLCVTGLEALQKLREHESFDILITDLQMPGLDGLKFIDQLRTFNEDIGVIVVSGNDENITSEIEHRLVIDSVIVKPVERNKLLGEIKSFIRKQN